MTGYSGAPLRKKLGLQPGKRVAVINSPLDYATLLEGLPENLTFTSLQDGRLDFIHAFVRTQAELVITFPTFQSSLAKTGMLWISWPKKNSGIDSDLNENIIRDIGLHNGLVDVKVCAINEHWSGLKFVFRLKDR
jgi:hypothetical protein